MLCFLLPAGNYAVNDRDSHVIPDICTNFKRSDDSSHIQQPERADDDEDRFGGFAIIPPPSHSNRESRHADLAYRFAAIHVDRS